MFNVHPEGSVPRHIHTHLAIFVDGENFVIPASVGHTVPGPMIGTFNEDAHTHTDDGILHYNEGTTTTFRNLAEFFTTWGAVFNKNRLKLPIKDQPGQFVDRSTNATHVIRFFVNGAEQNDFELYEPEDGDQIVISYEARAGAFGPRLNPINNVTMVSNPGSSTLGRTMHVPLDGSHPQNATINYTATSSDSRLGVQVLPRGNRSLRLNVSGRDIEGRDFTGDLTFQLFEDLTPRTTARIIELVRQGFYNNLKFHRVINDFVAQGGDPAGNGTGGSGTKFSDEFHPQLTFTGYAQLAMANSGDDTNDSQFFITDSNLGMMFLGSSDNQLPPRHLNFQHTIFGQLMGGYDVLLKMMLTPVTGSTPRTTLKINSATIVEDLQRGVLRLTAPPGFTGKANVTVTGTDSRGDTARRTFVVTVAEDTHNDRAFLGSLRSDYITPVNTPLTIDLPATDLENDALTFAVRSAANFVTNPVNVTVNINQATRQATLTPASGFVGNVELLIGVRDGTRRTDTNGDGKIDNLDDLDVQPNFDTARVRLTVYNPTWTNPALVTDVDNNGLVTPLDALLVINELSSRTISDPVTGRLPAPTAAVRQFLDVSPDGIVSPLDALLVINALPRSSASSSAAAISMADDSAEGAGGDVAVGALRFDRQSEPPWVEAIDSVWAEIFAD